jgi:hypothetical protein
VRFLGKLSTARLVADGSEQPTSDAPLAAAAIALFLVVLAGASLLRLAARLPRGLG